jgi:hypothetical protein
MQNSLDRSYDRMKSTCASLKCLTRSFQDFAKGLDGNFLHCVKINQIQVRPQ